jgi:hypothetical protein
MAAGRQQISGKGFPDDKLGLGLFLLAFSAIRVLFFGGSIGTRIGEKNEADRDYQYQKKQPYIGFRLHEQLISIL